MGVELVVGCFSTALLTASQLYGLPVARLGTELMLERLTPFENSIRIPVTLADALVPDLTSLAAQERQLPSLEEPDVKALVASVGSAMQPLPLAVLRSEAVAFLTTATKAIPATSTPEANPARLPGSLPAQKPPPKAARRQRLSRHVRSARIGLGRRLLGIQLPSSSSDKSASPTP